MMKTRLLSLLALSVFTTGSTQAFELVSQDIQEGHPMAKKFEYNDWGCDGDNVSPQLKWKDVPKGTKSFALTVYDPDAPTGSGFWHWIALDIPSKTTELGQSVDISKLGGKEVRNDYGSKGFGGACPPKGHGMHRYKFTVWALPKATLGLDENTPPAVVGFTLNSIAVDRATLTATYVR